MPTLIVVAHPDDEVLGCGATAHLLASRGEPVFTCILSGAVEARQNRPEIPELHADTYAASTLLGLQKPIFGPFDNIKFNTVPTLEMVQFIEKAIMDTGADTIFTHHPNDLNDDHLHTSRACQAASRLYQRRSGVPRLKALHLMEILSSTDWTYSGTSSGFAPNSFVEIGEEGVSMKIKALACYRGVPRPFPHPRSEEILRGAAAYRGGQAGMRYAEAFQTVFSVL